MKTFLIAISVILGLLCGSTAFADAKESSRKELGAELNKAYAEYQRLAAEQKWRESLPNAKRAYELGMKLLGRKRETVVIAFDYGRNLKQVRNYGEAAQVFEAALSIGEEVYGKNSGELIPILTNLGFVVIFTEKDDDYKTYYDRALKISELVHGPESVETAKLILQFADDILRNDGPREVRDYVFRAHEILKKQLGDKHSLTGYAAFQLGKYSLTKSDFRKAKSYFQETLNTFDNPDAPDSQIEMITHGFLVEVNERLGNREEATRHCLAIGRMTPAKDTQDFFPIFNLLPEYPQEAARKRKEGDVLLEFTVDSSGFVVDPKVVRSTDPVFDKASLEAVKKFRYAPQFADGKPVAVARVQQKINFKME